MKSDSKITTRDLLWPIYGDEHKKFIPLSIMMALVLFNYSMLRSVKDGLVVTGIGTEALSFLKTYFVFPSAIFATFMYSALCQFMDSKKVFYVFAGLFGLYFFVFAYEFFPNTGYYHINQATIDGLCQWAPRMKWFFKIYQNWTFCTFYVIAELWGSMMLSLFFWQLANQVTRISEAKRFYPMYALIGNLGLIATGTFLSYVMDADIDADATDIAGFKTAINMLLISLSCIIALNWYIQNVIATDPRLVDLEKPSTSKKKKAKLGLWESIKVIFSSPYIGLVAMLVVCYGISTVVIEQVWKDRVKMIYPTKSSYTAFMGQFQFFQGIVTMIFTLAGANIMRRFSWTTASMLTPLMILFTGILFFTFIYMSSGDVGIAATSSAAALTNPIYVGVVIGMIQNILSKGTKYALFDPTQKMTYVPLSDDMKTKGMSAVEVIGGRLGKMGGGLVVSSLLIVFSQSTLAQLTPILSVVSGLIVFLWIASVRALGQRYEAAVAESEKEKAAASA